MRAAPLGDPRVALQAVLLDQRALLFRRGYTDVGGDRLPKGQREKAGAMDPSALYRRYVKAQERAGIRRLRFHDLRRTFGTQAIASGAHVMDVKDWMGHRHLSTTMRYVHHQPRHEAAERLGRHFSGRPPNSTRCSATLPGIPEFGATRG